MRGESLEVGFCVLAARYNFNQIAKILLIKFLDGLEAHPTKFFDFWTG